MPEITPRSITAARAAVTWAARAAAAVLLAWGGYLFLKKLFFALGQGPGGFDHMFRVYTEIGEGHSTYRGMAAIMIGAALAVLSRRLARWIIAMPETGCPTCGYAGSSSDTCPECGLRGLHHRDQPTRSDAPAQ